MVLTPYWTMIFVPLFSLETVVYVSLEFFYTQFHLLHVNLIRFPHMSLWHGIISQKHNAITIMLHSRDGALALMYCVQFLLSTEAAKLTDHSKLIRVKCQTCLRARCFQRILCMQRFCTRLIHEVWFLFMFRELFFHGWFAALLLVAFLTIVIHYALRYDHVLEKLTCGMFKQYCVVVYVV